MDLIDSEAQYKAIEDVPEASYDRALVCTPDGCKFRILSHLLKHKKHFLVEKPLFLEESQRIHLKELGKGLVTYTAYNHRFEPHFIRMKKLIESGVLGRIYYCRMFYGNGTAKDVKESAWRDTGAGVIHDLGSHLLDTSLFWFGDKIGTFKLSTQHTFENKASDHAILTSHGGEIFVALEMSLLSWRNSYSCDVVGEKGSAHITSLCKWGPSQFIHRNRILPSGRPEEETTTLVQKDPTWRAELDFFNELCVRGRSWDNLSNDQWIQKNMSGFCGKVG